MRLTWTEEIIVDNQLRRVVYPRFVDPSAVVGVLAGNGPTVVLLRGGHQVPVDQTTEIVWEKVCLARGWVAGYGGIEGLEPEPNAGPSPVPLPGPTDEELHGDVELMPMHDGPMFPEGE